MIFLEHPSEYCTVDNVTSNVRARSLSLPSHAGQNIVCHPEKCFPNELPPECLYSYVLTLYCSELPTLKCLLFGSTALVRPAFAQPFRFLPAHCVACGERSFTICLWVHRAAVVVLQCCATVAFLTPAFAPQLCQPLLFFSMGVLTLLANQFAHSDFVILELNCLEAFVAKFFATTCCAPI